MTCARRASASPSRIVIRPRASSSVPRFSSSRSTRLTVARLVPATGPHALKGSQTGVAMTAGLEEDLYGTGLTWDLE